VELETLFSSVSGQPYRGYAGIEGFIRDNNEQLAQFGSDHRIVRARIYADIDAARKAAGLRH